MRSLRLQSRFVAVVAAVALPLFYACTDHAPSATAIEHYDKPLWTSSGDIVNIGGIRVLSDGRIIVADFGAKELWLMGADGKNIKSIGKHGSGPNEFVSIRGVLPLPGDSTLLIDADQRRVLVLDENGKAVQTVAISSKVPQWAIGMITTRTDTRGRMIMPASFMLNPEDKDVPLLRWDWKSDHLDSIARVVVVSSYQIKTKTTMNIYMVPFTPEDWVQPLANGETAIIRADKYEVNWVDAAGALRRGDTISYKRITVADTERTDADLSFRNLVPTVKPPFDASYAVASPEGELWVKKEHSFNADSIDYDILSASGKHVRTVRLRKQSRVRAVTSKRVYISHYNADDFEVLEAFDRK